VLLLRWKDENLGVGKEIARLEYVFSDLYRFAVTKFTIPSKAPGSATTSQVLSFLDKARQSTLLIVYYGGHGFLSKRTNEPPIWAA
jgi:hypothetical protein